MIVKINSTDGVINYDIPCFSEDPFYIVEEKLYEKFEKYREANNIFVYGGRAILRYKSIKENKIDDSMPILFIVFNSQNNSILNSFCLFSYNNRNNNNNIENKEINHNMNNNINNNINNNLNNNISNIGNNNNNNNNFINNSLLNFVNSLINLNIGNPNNQNFMNVNFNNQMNEFINMNMMQNFLNK